MIKDIIEKNTLLDFYGSLLSTKQFRALEMYYSYDYSLNEIAEDIGITKQAVSDNIKRGEQNLLKFEENLKLIESYNNRLKTRDELCRLVDELEENSLDIDLNSLEKIKIILSEEV